MEQGSPHSKTTAPVFIPVASGKGGVGKSLFAANLAICLAAAGERVVAVDLDLGGSNLHACLGLGNTHAGIGDFINDASLELAQLVTPTPFEGLGFLAGDGVTPFLANLGYFQKLKLIRSLQDLPADFVVADLGAGSSFNTLDFFALSRRGVVMATPDTLSLLNAMTFLKHYVLRQIGQVLSSDHRFKELMEVQKHQGLRIPAGSVSELLRQIEALDRGMAAKVAARLNGLRPRLVLNQADSPDDLRMLQPVIGNLAEKLSLTVESFGLIPFDLEVRRNVRERGVLVRNLPESRAAQGVQRIADRVVRLWSRDLEDSLERLFVDSQGWLAPALSPGVSDPEHREAVS